MNENKASFFERLQPVLSPSSLLTIKLAYTLAKFNHRAQQRKETDCSGNVVRYFEHPRRVAIILIDEVKIVDPNMIITSLLHDSIEDTVDLTPEMIEHCFGSDVSMMINCLSKVPKEGYIERLMSSVDWRVLVVKACDRLDNLRSLSQTDEQFQTKQIIETKTKYFPIFEKMTDLAPKHYKNRITDLYFSIRDCVHSLEV